jgi:hypothetical protein
MRNRRMVTRRGDRFPDVTGEERDLRVRRLRRSWVRTLRVMT